MQILVFTKLDKNIAKKYIKTIFLISMVYFYCCTTIKINHDYKTNFKVLESHSKYIDIDVIKATNEYIYIQITNNSLDIVKINWQNTSLNNDKIVFKKEDLTINNEAKYKSKYREFFIGPKTSFKFKAYPLKIYPKNKNSNALSLTIKYPSIFKLNITKAEIETKKTINILITRTIKINATNT
ncbi:hypothetical protein [Borreliella japonica]|uniref:Uncharacterized protein n=1 Tax=Borreliella japonica TaxID=34095 RepID=A0A1G4P1X1_BORJA|nr:hypothetical protein [Borreliella japonica]WKC88466.1 hypothetical protein QIA21_04835 [Borreliella japonica]WKC89444.1 hypothetical protein QIA20_04850 [Borreliella japonica]SCW26240.1 hypothetical protein SAMN02983004_00006 [Borreliella japonica]